MSTEDVWTEKCAHIKVDEQKLAVYCKQCKAVEFESAPKLAYVLAELRRWCDDAEIENQASIASNKPLSAAITQGRLNALREVIKFLSESVA